MNIQYWNLLIKMTESSSKIIFKQLPEDDPKQRRPDITKAKRILNWEPKVSLEEGLKKTILSNIYTDDNVYNDDHIRSKSLVEAFSSVLTNSRCC